MDIGKRIREIRKIKGIKSQTKLAELLNTTRDRIANIEQNRISIDDMFVSYFCKEFSVNEHWLYTGEGEIFSEQTITLDEYAKQNSLDDVEIEIVKLAMSIPREERKRIIKRMKEIFIDSCTNDEITLTKDLSLEGMVSAKQILGFPTPNTSDGIEPKLYNQ